MGSVNLRTSRASKGFMALSTWTGSGSIYSLAINLGNNSMTRIEIVSLLNCLNLGRDIFHYNFYNCLQKYNPKVYFGAIQTVTDDWNYDKQDPAKVDQKWVTDGQEKSGSLYLVFIYNIIFIFF